MAAYYHGSSEIQSVNSSSAQSDHQTLYLMNPTFLSSYSDHNQQQQQSPSNMLFFNNLNHTPPINHDLLGTTALRAAAATDNNCHSNSSEYVPAYNMWACFDQNSVDARGVQLVASPTRQGLSLTLSSQQVQPMMSSGGEDMRVSGNSPQSVSAASNGVQSAVLGSKYLQAAQELLDEVVNMGEGIEKEKMRMTKASESKDESSCSGNEGGRESSSQQGIELTTTQRQELQMKKAKLVIMLDEVEQRYKQYRTHMQIIVSSFEQAAGFGAAKSYTSLALRTISKQFRSLKDALSGQIKSTTKSLGEEDCLGLKVEGSRLKYVDHQLRQQRALQQLGMLQHNNAWRPQRGLPEPAVSVLRAWLFDHFLHPYPKDSDKHILAKQTGLTRSQVSNWFINARVRLWKPMVEEMYLEELKEQEKTGGTDENATKDMKKDFLFSNAGDDSTNLQSSEPQKPIKPNQNASPIKPSTMVEEDSSIQPQKPGFTLIKTSELKGISHNDHDMQNSTSSILLSVDMDMKHGETSKEMINMINFGGGFGGYNTICDVCRFSPEQLGPRFGANSNVSLTLGLQHCENLTLSSSHHQNLFSNHNIQLKRRLEIPPGEPDYFEVNNSQNSHSTTGVFENIDIENRKRFISQLLPDFVS